MTTRFVLGVLLAGLGGAGTMQPDGHEIVATAVRRAAGFGDYSATLTMTLRDGDGSERIRTLTVRTLEMANGGQRILVEFTRPSDLRGTALLTVDRPAGPAEQWLYLPALKRVRRIARGARTGSFMGSEFAYEDVMPLDTAGFRNRVVREDNAGAWVVERIPGEGTSTAYRRQLIWVDREAYRVRRIEYLGPGPEPIKTLEVAGYRLHDGRFWRPDTMTMTNHLTGAVTALEWSDQRFGTGLARRMFDPEHLGRSW